MIDINAVWVVLVAVGIPSGIIGLMFRRLEKKLDKQEKKRDEKELLRIDMEKRLIDLSIGSLDLSIATAEAVQRIPEAHCNGDMTTALDRANKTLESYREEERRQVAKIMVQSA